LTGGAASRLENFADVFGEAHVEHAIGFVGTTVATACTSSYGAADDRAAARAYRPPVRAFFERARLSRTSWPPVKASTRGPAICDRAAQLARDLSTKLACRTDHQAL